MGYTFRRSKNRWGKLFVNFTPAVSTDAMTKMRQEMRRWRLPLRSDKAIDDLAPSIPRAVVKGLDSPMDCVREKSGRVATRAVRALLCFLPRTGSSAHTGLNCWGVEEA